MNGDDLSLRHMRAFMTVMRERSLTRAAEALDTTQPAMSKMLARLRAYFDDPLFVRAGHALEPTPRALALEEPLRAMLRTASHLLDGHDAFDPAVATREFRLLLTDVGMLHFLPALMERLAHEGPGIRVHAMPLEHANWERRLEAGEADLAIGDLPWASRDLRRQQFYSEGCRTLVCADHPRRDRLHDPEAFLAEEHVLVGRSGVGHGVHALIESALAAHLPVARIRLRLPSFFAAAAVAKRGGQLVTMPANLADFTARAFDMVAFEPPVAMPEISIAQFWHERMQRDDAHRWFRALLHAMFRNKQRWD